LFAARRGFTSRVPIDLLRLPLINFVAPYFSASLKLEYRWQCNSSRSLRARFKSSSRHQTNKGSPLGSPFCLRREEDLPQSTRLLTPDRRRRSVRIYLCNFGLVGECQPQMPIVYPGMWSPVSHSRFPPGKGIHVTFGNSPGCPLPTESDAPGR